jgi:hypothetical protein
VTGSFVGLPAPTHPQQNGRHERMHLTLKLETTRPAAQNFLRPHLFQPSENQPQPSLRRPDRWNQQVDDHLWLATCMHYDLGYFDDETCRLEPISNPFGPKVLPMSPEWIRSKWRATVDEDGHYSFAIPL